MVDLRLTPSLPDPSKILKNVDIPKSTKKTQIICILAKHPWPCDLYATLICSCQYQFIYPTSFNGIYIYIYIYASIHVCIYIYIRYTCTCIHVCIYIYKHICIHVYIYHIQIHIIHTISSCLISSHRHINDLLSCCNRSTIFSAKRSGALAVATAKLLHGGTASGTCFTGSISRGTFQKNCMFWEVTGLPF